MIVNNRNHKKHYFLMVGRTGLFLETGSARVLLSIAFEGVRLWLDSSIIVRSSVLIIHHLSTILEWYSGADESEYRRTTWDGETTIIIRIGARSSDFVWIGMRL